MGRYAMWESVYELGAAWKWAAGTRRVWKSFIQTGTLSVEYKHDHCTPYSAESEVFRPLPEKVKDKALGRPPGTVYVSNHNLTDKKH